VVGNHGLEFEFNVRGAHSKGHPEYRRQLLSLSRSLGLDYMVLSLADGDESTMNL
jgi:hypothetical protein